jgi:hypothetical protein
LHGLRVQRQAFAGRAVGELLQVVPGQEPVLALPRPFGIARCSSSTPG